jgi:hypothetical protein
MLREDSLAYGGGKASKYAGTDGYQRFLRSRHQIARRFAAGWVARAGTEGCLPRWSAKAEYLHYDLGIASFLNVPFSGALMDAKLWFSVSSERSSSR